MIWLSSISQLQINNPIRGIDCFCEELTRPDDLQLQGILTGGSNPYTVTIYAYSSDGVTQYQNITTYFSVTTFKGTNNQDYFNAKLNSFSQTMCANKCFIIRIVVTSNGGAVIFDNYTERYCVNSCCVTATGITFHQEGLEISGGDTPIVSANTARPTTPCGNPLIRIISQFDCIDNFTGNFFGDSPSTVYSGTYYRHVMITTIKGRVVRRPRDIRREISYNCRLQRTETEPTYFLEGLEYIPAWKMYEIEGQLCANNLWVDDYDTYREYVFQGGTPFKKVDGAQSCTEIFKLETTLNGCTQRQIYGCAVNCSNTSVGFLIVPDSYAGGSWFDENGRLVATVFNGDESSPPVPGLLQWLRTQDGITSVELLDLTGTSCEDYTYAIVQIDGTGLIPTSLYMDSATANNRLFVRVGADESQLCDYIGETPCGKPVAGTATIAALTCGIPVSGTIVISDITPVALTILAISPWVAESAPDTEASLYFGQVTFSFEGTKTVSAATGTEYTLLGEQIATIAGEGWPSATRVLDSGNTGGLTGDQTATISTSGIISVSGTFPITVDNELTFDFDNFLYSV